MFFTRTFIAFYYSSSIFNIVTKTEEFGCQLSLLRNFLSGWHSDLVTLERALNSYDITLTPILAKILTHDPLLLRKSVLSG